MASRSNRNKVNKYWFKVPKNMALTEEGRAIMALELGESTMLTYKDERHPEGPAEAGLFGRRFSMVPEETGMRVTRLASIVLLVLLSSCSGGYQVERMTITEHLCNPTIKETWRCVEQTPIFFRDAIRAYCDTSKECLAICDAARTAAK